jgi:hypothetical protein
MTAFATTANAVALPVDAVPVASVEGFRRDVLATVAGGRRLLLLTGLPENGSTRLLAALADDASGQIGLTACLATRSYPALTPDCPSAHYFEREIFESCGLRPEGHPWLKPVRFPPGGPAIGDADFFQVSGSEVHEVAVGPVHAGVIEPGHFRFNCHGERVFHLEISLGYQHRGVERMLRGGPDRRSVHVAETLAGDTSTGHATAYCQAVEALAATPCSPRALSWRAVALELERIANHIGDLGALAGDVGFLPAAAYCGRLRGDALNLSALLCGSRLGRGWVRPGGVAREPGAEVVAELKQRLAVAARDMVNAVDLLWKSSSVRARFERTATSPARRGRSRHHGPAARASGIDRDAPARPARSGLCPAPASGCGRRDWRRLRPGDAALARDREFARLPEHGARRSRRRRSARLGRAADTKRGGSFGDRGLARRDRASGRHRRGREVRALQGFRSVVPQLVRPGDGDARPGDPRFSALQQELQPVLLRP